jgi:molybdopterin biosynthesis enzyme
VPCTLARDDAGELLAAPIFGASNLIFTLVRSDALIVVPLDRSGLAAGERVRVVVP